MEFFLCKINFKEVLSICHCTVLRQHYTLVVALNILFSTRVQCGSHSFFTVQDFVCELGILLKCDDHCIIQIV